MSICLNQATKLSAAEWARQLRVPFHDIELWHPTFPQNTLLYFIDPITPTTGGLSGMSMVRYGAGVWVKNWTEYADFRQYNTAYVYYFDATRRPREILVDQNAATRIAPALSVDFGASIQVPRTTVKRGDPIVLMLYWRAIGKIDRDYTMFAHLVAPDGTVIAAYDSAPRKGRVPTSQWNAMPYIADSIVIPVNANAPIGSNDRIEIGWYDSATRQRLDGTAVIAPFNIVP